MKTTQNQAKIIGNAFTSSVCLLLLMVSVWTGCNRNTKETVKVDPTGTYSLASIDGRPVPCTLNHEGASPLIKSGVFVVSSDGTCSSKISFSMPSGGEASREVKATYTRQGSKLTMRWEGAGTTMGDVAANTFIMTNEGMVFAYRK